MVEEENETREGTCTQKASSRRRNQQKREREREEEGREEKNPENAEIIRDDTQKIPDNFLFIHANIWCHHVQSETNESGKDRRHCHFGLSEIVHTIGHSLSLSLS